MPASIWNNLLDIVFPPCCLVCGRDQDDDELFDTVCAACFLQVRQCVQEYSPHKAIDRIVRYGSYQDGNMRSLIHAFKYRGVKNLAGPLAELQARALEEAGIEGLCFGEKPVLTFVPLHPFKQRWRGYNQAQLLAAYLADYFSLPLASLLARPFITPSQASLSSSLARKLNSQGIFTLTISNVPQKILLVDDVWTSGFTLASAAKLLRKAGAKTIWAVTVA